MLLAGERDGDEMSTVTAEALGSHQFLRGMRDTYLAYMAEAASLVTVPVRHRFFEAGGVARHFWLIRAGQVALDVRACGDGQRIVVESLGRGEVVGLPWFLFPHRLEFGAITLQPTEAFEIDGQQVRLRCDEDPGFGYEFTRRLIIVVVRRLQSTRIRLVEFAGTAR